MKWTENGVTFEGSVAEYKELHSDGFRQQLPRTRAGRHVSVIAADGSSKAFTSVKDAAAWIGQQTGRYVSASTLGRMLNDGDTVNLEQFAKGGSPLFEPNVGTDLTAAGANAMLLENNN